MIANVSTSSDIAFTLAYGQNPEKGGGIILCNYTDERAGAEQQARAWDALSNPYRNKCYTIVVSFGNKDTEKIRQMPFAERAAYERKLLMAFLNELSERGNNVYDCPFVVAHHGNTDNEHFHIAILNTTIDGKHFRDSFIKKNACRAAAKVSMDFGLEVPEKAARNERNHQKTNNRKCGKPNPKELVGNENVRRQSRKRTYNRVSKDPNELRYRAERIRMAESRKKSCKSIIEAVAMDKSTTPSNFVTRLFDHGLRLYHDPISGYYVIIHDDKEDKDYTYSLGRQLGVDLSLLPVLDNSAIERPLKSNKEKRAVKRSVPRTPSKPNSLSLLPSASKAANFARNLNVQVGSQGGQTQQGNERPDGTVSHDYEDEEWRQREGGYHM